MQAQTDRIVYSATDLNNFLACRYLTALDLDAARRGLTRPKPFEDERNLLAELGDKHERQYLQSLRAQGFDVAEIASHPTEAAAEATIAAMRDGRDIIYQATFLDGHWMGRADFLRKVPNRSGMTGNWAWHYEVEDTKLARHTEPYFLLQLCYYSEHVARIAGIVPEQLYVVLGDGLRRAFRLADFAAYYRAVKAAFEAHVKETGESLYPLPVPHCERCDWSAKCKSTWRDDDHLTLVANITRTQMARLNESGVATLAQLAGVEEAQRPPKMERSTFEKLRRQARLQLAQREAEAVGAPPVPPEFLPHDAQEWLHKGFALLPEPIEGDCYFDMEGDPYYDLTASLEYLFGVYTSLDDAYLPFWGCDRSERPLRDRLAEKRAFKAFVDWVIERHARHPGMHVYHYAAYEKTKLQELSVRHATREEEVDTILREGLLVDLYTVVRQSIAVGQPSYSIKNLELYFGKRGEAGVKSGDQSILQFEAWLTGRNEGRRDDALLDDLQKYNEFDCVSTHRLHEWLLGLRERAARETGVEIPYHQPAPEEVKERTDPLQELKDALVASLPTDFDPESDAPELAEARYRWMALQMLEYHWREEKPLHWKFHDRCAIYAEDPHALLDDADVLVGVELVSSIPDKKSILETYRAPIQEFKADKGACHAPLSKERIGEVESVEIDDDFVTLTIRRGPSVMKRTMNDAIVIRNIVRSGPIRTALATFARALLDGTAVARYAAALDILACAIPRRVSRSRASIQPTVADEVSIGAVIADLDDSYLFVQGPPGSGKTYTAARLVASLIRAGKRVGISANSHQAMHNLLEELEEYAVAQRVPLRGLKLVSKTNPGAAYESRHGLIENGNAVGGDANLIAGTAWAMCPAFEDEPLDVLFIDEAGQVSLPNALALGTTARSVVLLGDPLQLAHVSQTSHPGGIGRSVLQHLLGDDLRPVSPDRGVLLTSTYRMNVPICSYISDLMYEGRLHPANGRELQSIRSTGISGQGLRYESMLHENNRQRSEQEAEFIADAAATLLLGTVTGFEGVARPLVPDDIIVVTPYNAQVRCIARVMRTRGGPLADIAVGTVDKFQGREAHVVFFSTAASSVDDAPRGINFLFDRNRLNVAISRARSVAVTVGSGALLTGACRSVEDARSMNMMLSFVERSRES